MRSFSRFGLIALCLAAGLPVATGAALAADTKAVRIGVVPSQSVKVLVEQYQPLMDYLAKKTDRPFELRPMPSYDEIVAKLKSAELEGGVFGSFVANRAIREISAKPVARAEKKGVSTYRGFVIVRQDSGIKTIEGLKGKSFDYVDRNTSAGYVFPRALLKEKKLDPETFFSRSTFAGKHDIALSKVLNKESDGAAIKDNVFEKLAATDPRVAREIVVIHKSERFPDGTILVRRDLPEDLVKAIRSALLGLKADAAGNPALSALGADRFIETGAADFAYLNRLMAAVGGK